MIFFVCKVFYFTKYKNYAYNNLRCQKMAIDIRLRYNQNFCKKPEFVFISAEFYETFVRPIKKLIAHIESDPKLPN